MKNSENKELKKTPKTKQKTSAKTKKQGKIGGWITFFKEVRSEMRKVTWPPKKEIIGSTTALIIATLFVGIFLGGVDLILAQAIRPALSGTPVTMSYVALGMFIAVLIWMFRSN